MLLCVGEAGSWAQSASADTGPQAKYVIVISIDGLRADAVTATTSPRLFALMGQGAYATSATTVRPPMTLAAHSSMLTGLDYPRHRVSFNDYRPGRIPYTTVFDVVKEAGMENAAFIAKSKLRYLVDPQVVDYVYGDGPPGVGKYEQDITAAAIAQGFVSTWPNHSFALTFIHFNEPDIAGHQHRWMSASYLQAVALADRALGAILESVASAGRTASTAIIVTSDHGGKGYRHWLNLGGIALIPYADAIMQIPWVVAGPGVQPGPLQRRVRIYDTAPTVLSFLGLEFAHEVDGSAVAEIWGADR